MNQEAVKKRTMHPLEQHLGQSILREKLFAPGCRILIGVSGGADSLALLHILAALHGLLAINLKALYVDHGLRPQETPAEWICVQEHAQALQIESARACADVYGIALQQGLSLEHAARKARYQAFQDFARLWQADLIAVAHTADDQAEEILLRLFRGGGRKALSGMRKRSGHLVRPLLDVRKAELLTYLAAKGVQFCHDSSNEDRRFLRNRIRLDLLPLLEADYDPGIRQALLKTASNLRDDEDLLESLLDQQWQQVVTICEREQGAVWQLDRARFLALHPALQRRLIEKLLWCLGDMTRYEHIMAVLQAALNGRNGSELHLSRGLRVFVARTHLDFTYPKGRGPWRGRL